MDKTLVRTEESAGAVVRGCSVKKGVLKNFAKFTGKYLYLSLLNEVSGTEVCKFIKI